VPSDIPEIEGEFGVNSYLTVLGVLGFSTIAKSRSHLNANTLACIDCKLFLHVKSCQTIKENEIAVLCLALWINGDRVGFLLWVWVVLCSVLGWLDLVRLHCR
jgi:hypothetical protein